MYSRKVLEEAPPLGHTYGVYIGFGLAFFLPKYPFLCKIQLFEKGSRSCATVV
ncbi:hypothetical protein F383_27786 [Gossypium arboreum]|uniref:Uncharacterized protein n=1 Tax=Gossypium arboreum TaxID=29729 RepID=A0A0B0PBZ7_GOSAR|nr:hypothetical protein F383_27786 [Gossypium arboreum]